MQPPLSSTDHTTHAEFQLTTLLLYDVCTPSSCNPQIIKGEEKTLKHTRELVHTQLRAQLYKALVPKHTAKRSSWDRSVARPQLHKHCFAPSSISLSGSSFAIEEERGGIGGEGDEWPSPSGRRRRRRRAADEHPRHVPVRGPGGRSAHGPGNAGGHRRRVLHQPAAHLRQRRDERARVRRRPGQRRRRQERAVHARGGEGSSIVCRALPVYYQRQVSSSAPSRAQHHLCAFFQSLTLSSVYFFLLLFPAMMQSCLNFVYLAFVVLAVAFMGKLQLVNTPSPIYYSCTSFTVHMCCFSEPACLQGRTFPLILTGTNKMFCTYLPFLMAILRSKRDR